MAADANKQSILVTGATGAQGGAVVRALLAEGRSVRALVRSANGPGAEALAQSGVELARGSFEDEEALRAALHGAHAVFSVQLYNPNTPESETRQAGALIAAARAAGCAHFVQTSVSGVGEYLAMPADGRWDDNYWRNKAEIEAKVAASGFSAFTVLRPAFMMENFAPPKAARMFPQLAQGKLVTAIAPETKLSLVAAADIGHAVAAALDNAERFSGAALELCGDWLTLEEIAAVLRDNWGREVKIDTRAAADLVVSGQSAGWVQTQEWLNQVGYPARPSDMTDWGLEQTTFAEWAAAQPTPRFEQG